MLFTARSLCSADFFPFWPVLSSHTFTWFYFSFVPCPFQSVQQQWFLNQMEQNDMKQCERNGIHYEKWNPVTFCYTHIGIGILLFVRCYASLISFYCTLSFVSFLRTCSIWMVFVSLMFLTIMTVSKHCFSSGSRWSRKCFACFKSVVRTFTQCLSPIWTVSAHTHTHPSIQTIHIDHLITSVTIRAHFLFTDETFAIDFVILCTHFCTSSRTISDWFDGGMCQLHLCVRIFEKIRNKCNFLLFS